MHENNKIWLKYLNAEKIIWITKPFILIQKLGREILDAKKIATKCLSLSLLCLYQDNGDTQVPGDHTPSHLFIDVAIPYKGNHLQPLCLCSCKQHCYPSRHLEPPTHLEIYCLFQIFRVELHSVWLYGLRGGMTVGMMWAKDNTIYWIKVPIKIMKHIQTYSTALFPFFPEHL